MDPQSSSGPSVPDQLWSDTTQDYVRMAEDPVYTPLPEDVIPTKPLVSGWVLLVGLILALYWAWALANRWYNKYRLRQDVLDRRRRAGIPDEDSRPFDVAHAAAALKRRQEAEDMMRAEKARVEALHQARDSEWAQLGRQMTGSQGHVRGPGYGYEGLVQRRPGQGIFPTASQPGRIGFGQPLPSPTISSSDSPPYAPVVPAYQDQYAPPAIRAANEQARQRASVQPTSTLGRRSRKHLMLSEDDDADSQYDPNDQSHPQRSRRRLDGYEPQGKENQWGNGTSQVSRTRKRVQEEDDEEDEDTKAKLRKVAEQVVPGGFKPSSAIAGPHKRKDREEEETDEEEPVEKALEAKQKKRVRVMSRQVSGTMVDDTEMAGEEEGEEGVKADATEVIRHPGEEWEEDGVKYKMADNGLQLRETYVKDRARFNSSSRLSPSKHTVYSITKRWMTPEEYVTADKAGQVTTEYDAETLLTEVKKYSRGNSPFGSDWESVAGQTPLKTGGLRTVLGSDVPAPPLPLQYSASAKLPVEQTRLTHLSSPVRKNIPYGKGGLTLGRTGPMSPWERKKAEADALTALRSARSKSKAEAAAAEAAAAPKPSVTFAALPTVIPPPIIVTSASVPVFNLSVPTPTETKAPAPATTATSTEATKPAGAAPAPKAADAPKPNLFPSFTIPSATSAAHPPLESKTPSALTSFSFAKQEAVKHEPPKPATNLFAQPPAAPAPAPSAPAPTPLPAFSFSAPAPAQPQSHFGATPQHVQPTSTTQDNKPAANPFAGVGTTPATSAPTTSFSTNVFGNPAPQNSFSNPSATNTTSTPAGPLPLFGTAAPKPAASGFSFGAAGASNGFGSFGAPKPQNPAPMFGSNTAASTTTASAPTFSFGGPSQAPQAMEANKPATGLSIRGASTQDSNVASPSPFGTQTTGFNAAPAAGGSGFSFGAQANKPTTPAFGGFGGGGTGFGSAAPTPTALAPPSLFGQQQVTTPAPGAGFSFNFGQPKTDGAISAATTPVVPTFGASPAGGQRATKALPRPRR